MKYIIVLSTLTILALSSYSQDLVVTNKGDSINCKILATKNNNIYFKVIKDNEVHSTFLPRVDVTDFEYNFFQQSEVPVDKATKSKKPVHDGYRKFRVGLNIGFAYMIASISEDIPTEFKDYIKELKTGFQFGADISYFLSERWGLGLKYTFFRTSNSIENIAIEDENGNIRTGSMSDDIKTQFFGPTVSMRIPNRINTNAFFMGLGLGYIGYTNDAVIIDSYIIKGSSFGMTYDIGYDIGLSDNLFLGLQLSFLIGSLSEYEVESGSGTQTIELEDGNHESLSRLDLSIGLRFSK